MMGSGGFCLFWLAAGTVAYMLGQGLLAFVWIAGACYFLGRWVSDTFLR